LHSLRAAAQRVGRLHLRGVPSAAGGVLVSVHEEALQRAEAAERLMSVDIREAGRGDLPRVRELFVALDEGYAAIGVSLCFQDFERELSTLPGAYAPPRGRILLAFVEGALAGCVALRPLA